MKYINKVIAYVLIAIMTLSYGLETKQLKSYAQDENLETEVMDSDDSVDDQVMTVSDAEVYEEDVYEEDVTDEEIDVDGKIKVLFIGNSKTFYNNVPALVNNLASKKGLSFTWDAMTYSSRTLKGHYSDLKKAINGDDDAVEEYVEFYKKMIKAGSYDVVVLQEQTGRALETTADKYLAGARDLLNLLLDNGLITQKTPIVINSIWGDFSATGLDFSRHTITKTCWDDYTNQNITIDKNSTTVRTHLKNGTTTDGSAQNLKKYTNVQIANTGVAFNKYLSDEFYDAEKLTTGQRYTAANQLILLDKKDVNHAQVRGSYLEACVLLQAISVGLKQAGRISESVTFDSYVYYDGIVKNCVARLDGKKNYETTTPNYSMHTNPVTVDEATYQKMQRASNGMVNSTCTGWYKNNAGYSYYIYGCRQLGKIKDGGKTYHTDSHGIRQTGLTPIGEKWYYFDNDGVMQTGWQPIDGKRYYFSKNGVMVTDWQPIDEKWYYFDNDGVMQTGWLYRGQDAYYLGDDGARRIGWVDSGENSYYFREDGKLATGLESINGQMFYLSAAGIMQTGWQDIGGQWYYFDNKGVGAENWKKFGTKWFYFVNAAMVTGWKKIGDKMYYFNEEGVMQTGWQNIKNARFYFDDGAMATGLMIIGKKRYYFSVNGAMSTGLVTIYGKMYYFDANGEGVTGWKKISNAWHYFDNGATVTGWKSIGGKWYYFDASGMMVTGWKLSGGKWYYLDSNGKMVTGWKLIGGKWYYFDTNGAMLSGTTIKLDGKYYTFNSNGELVK